MRETISLYLDLKPGEKPDFEVVGRAAAAFAEAVKELAYIIDPGCEVRLPFGEFSYHMADERFLADLLAGRRKLAMKQGIQLTARIETYEQYEGGVWVPTKRFILKVIKVHKQRKQLGLFSQPKKRPARKTKKR